MTQLFPSGTAEDLFFVGKRAYAQNDHVSAIEWFEAALALLDKAHNSSQTHSPADASLRLQLLDYLAFSSYRAGDFDAAVTYSTMLLVLDPRNTRVADNLAYYRAAHVEEPTAMSAAAASAAAVGSDILHFASRAQRNFTEDNLLKHDDDEMADFRAICRGETIVVDDTPLTCQLVTYGNPALLLQPARIERMHAGTEELSVCHTSPSLSMLLYLLLFSSHSILLEEYGTNQFRYCATLRRPRSASSSLRSAAIACIAQLPLRATALPPLTSASGTVTAFSFSLSSNH